MSLLVGAAWKAGAPEHCTRGTGKEELRLVFLEAAMWDRRGPLRRLSWWGPTTTPLAKKLPGQTFQNVPL